jgi:hypothetical protein
MALLNEATRVERQDDVAMLSLGKGLVTSESRRLEEIEGAGAYFFLVVQLLGFKGSCGSENATM